MHIKAANFIGLIMIHFFMKCIYELSLGNYISSLVELFVSLLYFWLLKGEREIPVDRKTFFRNYNFPYICFALFAILDFILIKTTLMSSGVMISSLLLSIYALYILIAPKKSILGLDMEVHKLFGKLFK